MNDNTDIKEITEKMAQLKISETNQSVDIISIKEPINCAIDEIQDNIVRLKIFEPKSKIRKVEVTEEKKLKLEREPIIDLLDLCFPKLKYESTYWAPDISWNEMKNYTGIDLDEVMRLYKKYPEEEDEIIKDDLKRQFIDLFVPSIINSTRM